MVLWRRQGRDRQQWQRAAAPLGKGQGQNRNSTAPRENSPSTVARRTRSATGGENEQMRFCGTLGLHVLVFSIKIQPPLQMGPTNCLRATHTPLCPQLANLSPCRKIWLSPPAPCPFQR